MYEASVGSRSLPVRYLHLQQAIADCRGALASQSQASGAALDLESIAAALRLLLVQNSQAIDLAQIVAGDRRARKELHKYASAGA